MTLATFLFTCKDAGTEELEEPKTPFYLAKNGVTIKIKDEVKVGDTGEVNGVTYTAVDGAMLGSKVYNGKDLTKIVTTRVTNMEVLFIRKPFNQDISHWDVSNVTNMKAMFNGAKEFNQDISHWDVSKVKDMTRMFAGARSFNQDLSGWDVSSVTRYTDFASVHTLASSKRPKFE